MSDVKLRPYALKLAQLPPENEFAAVMPLLQTYMAVSRLFGVDTVFMDKFKGQFAMTQAGQKMAMNFTADSYGARGMRGDVRVEQRLVLAIVQAAADDDHVAVPVAERRTQLLPARCSGGLS